MLTGPRWRNCETLAARKNGKLIDFMPKPIFVLAVMAAIVAATPALAQFNNIFSDPPPRPPGDVPRGNVPPPNFPTNRNDPAQQQQPQAQPQVQQQAPRGNPGSIQSQSLPPPPGAPAVPLETNQQPQALPGLPPGQRQPRSAPQPVNPPPQQPANTAPQPGDEIVVQPPEQKIANPTAVFSGLDKVTGRTIGFDVAINETVQFGALQVTPRVCYSRPPTETPNTDAFVVVDEVTLQGEVRRIFSGWMFAASPGLHAVEHPIYDVWLTDCKGATPAVVDAPPDVAAKPAAQKQTTPRQSATPAAQLPAAQPPNTQAGTQAGTPAGTQPPAQQQRRTQPAPQAQPNFLNPFR